MATRTYWEYVGNIGAGEGNAIKIPFPFPLDFKENDQVFMLESIEVWNSEGEAVSVGLTVDPSGTIDVTSAGFIGYWDTGGMSPSIWMLDNPAVLSEGYTMLYATSVLATSVKVIFGGRIQTNSSNPSLGMVTFGDAVFEQPITKLPTGL